MVEENKKLNRRYLWLIVIVGLLIALVVIVLVQNKRTVSLEEQVNQLKATVGERVSQQKTTVSPNEVLLEGKTGEIPEALPPEVSRGESVFELKGDKSLKTSPISLDKRERYNLAFYVALNDFPPENVIPSWKISIYKVGEKSPLKMYQEEISLESLKEHNWDPSIVEGGAKGNVGGIAGHPLYGPGEFYFEVEVKNIDRWVLRIR